MKDRIRILANEPTLASAQKMATAMNEKGLVTEVVDVAADVESRELAEKVGAGLEPLYPLIVVGDPKIRLLIWDAQPIDIERLTGAGNDVNGQDVRVFSSSWCPDCTRLKRYLDSKGVEHTEINIEEDSSSMDWVLTRSGGRRVVPSLAVGERTALFNPATNVLDRVLGLS